MISALTNIAGADRVLSNSISKRPCASRVSTRPDAATPNSCGNPRGRRIPHRVRTLHRRTGARPSRRTGRRCTGTHSCSSCPARCAPSFGSSPAVPPAPDRVDGEDDPVAPVVERIDEKPEVVVLQDVEAVAAHLVDHPLRLGDRIPGSSRDVEIRVVEQHPRVGPLGRRGPRNTRALS